MVPAKWKRRRTVIAAASIVAAGSLALASCGNGGTGATALTAAAESSAHTATPIKHVVVLFDENAPVSEAESRPRVQ